MGNQDPPRVLVAVEPALLGRVLTELLQGIGEDEVTNLADGATLPPPHPFSAALVSATHADEGIAEVVVVVPAPGQTMGQVHTGTATLEVDMQAPLAVLDVLDRFCPATRRRAALGAGWTAQHSPDPDRTSTGAAPSG